MTTDHTQDTQTGRSVVRRPIVGVMGSHSDPHTDLAQPLGRWLARQGYHLLTGAGPGVMTAVSQAFCQLPDRVGLTIGVIPGHPRQPGSPKTGYPNPWIEIPIFTHLDQLGDKGAEPMSRNHLNILTSDVVVALPGGAGTSCEVQLAVRYSVPLIAFLQHPQQIANLPEQVPVVDDLADVQQFITRHAPIESDRG